MRPVRRDPTGRSGPTKRQAAGPRWRRSSHGWFVPSCVDASRPEQRVLEASVVVPGGYGVTGWGALRWWSGCRWFDGVGRDGRLLPVSVSTATHGVRSQPGIDVSEERVRREDVALVDGVPLLVPTAALSFEVRRTGGVRAAVWWIDMAAYCDLVSLDELRAYAHHQAGWTGVPLLRRALALADENSWSPQESAMRLRWVLDAGLPPPRCNAAIFDRRGRHLLTVDLIDPVSGVVAEYDGAAWHTGATRRADVERDGLLADLGIERVAMVAGDRVGPRGFVQRLRRAHGRATDRARLPGGTPETRGWTLDVPPGWVATPTVASRRALAPREAARLLRYRRPDRAEGAG